MRACRAFGQFPLVVKEVSEEIVAPLRGRRGPNHFQSAADRVPAFACSELAPPAETLFLNVTGFRYYAHQCRVAGAMRLAKRVTAGNQRNSFFVVHSHAAKRLANIFCRCQRVWLAIWAFGVHVNQAHLHGSERVLKIAFTAISLIRQPLAFWAPVDVFLRLPGVGAPAAEAERLEAHRLKRHVARQNHQVRPGNLPPVFLLDRPQQSPRLIEVYVVRPAIERRESLLTCTRAAATVADAVRARAVPCHANEKRAIMAEIGRPPILRVRHQRVQVLNYSIQVETLEFLGIIEVFAHRIGQVRMLVKHLDVQLVRPPVTIRVCGRRARKRTFSFCCHDHSFSLITKLIQNLCAQFGSYLRAVSNLRESRRGAHFVQNPRKMSSHSRSVRFPRESAVGLGTSYHCKSSTLPQRSQIKW